MRRLLSTDGHGAASILGDFDRRWPWLNRQVDRPSGAGARVCYPINLTPRVGTRVWRADQARARVDTRVSLHLVPERSGR
eukprot:scaffold5504_cov53-Cyclotella_meneghiniana.AAC.11